jgi:hypothetical protein
MTPEERYAKIDERLDAIAMHLELTTAMVHDNETRFEAQMGRILTIVESLANTAADHQRRIERLEDQ